MWFKSLIQKVIVKFFLPNRAELVLEVLKWVASEYKANKGNINKMIGDIITKTPLKATASLDELVALESALEKWIATEEFEKGVVPAIIGIIT